MSAATGRLLPIFSWMCRVVTKIEVSEISVAHLPNYNDMKQVLLIYFNLLGREAHHKLVIFFYFSLAKVDIYIG